MTFTAEIIEILQDTDDSERFDRMADALVSAPTEEAYRITEYIAGVMEDMRPPLPDFLHNEYHAAMAAAFTFGVLIGREHARRGYTEPA